MKRCATLSVVCCYFRRLPVSAAEPADRSVPRVGRRTAQGARRGDYRRVSSPNRCGVFAPTAARGGSRRPGRKEPGRVRRGVGHGARQEHAGPGRFAARGKEGRLEVPGRHPGVRGRCRRNMPKPSRWSAFFGGPTGHRLWSESKAGFTMTSGKTHAEAFEWVADNRVGHTYPLTAMRMLRECGGITEGRLHRHRLRTGQPRRRTGQAVRTDDHRAGHRPRHAAAVREADARGGLSRSACRSSTATPRNCRFPTTMPT